MEVLADDLVIIAAGKLIAQGAVNEIVGSMATGSVVRVRTPNADALAKAVQEAGGQVAGNADGALRITGLETPAVGAAAFRAGVELHELVGERPDLEQVFFQLTEGKGGIR
jgi:ABC-2 type transport system ATP-binding protein